MIDELITQLDTVKTAGIVNTVAHAFTTTPTDLNESSDDLPAVYLYPGDDVANGPDADYCHDLLVTEAVHVMYVCSPGDLSAIKKAVRDDLIGFQPTTQEDALLFLAGAIVPDGIRGGVIWWRDTFTSDYLQTSEAE